MGTSFLKTSLVVGFLLLLPSLVYCDRYRSVSLLMYADKNCTTAGPTTEYADFNYISNWNSTFYGGPPNSNVTFEAAALRNISGDVLTLVACQLGFACNAPGAIQISFDLSDIGACQTARPPGTQFDKFLLS